MVPAKEISKAQIEKFSFDANFANRQYPNRTQGNNVKMDQNDKSLICDDCSHNCLSYEPSRDGFCNCGCH